jgi:hypothetical protein
MAAAANNNPLNALVNKVVRQAKADPKKAVALVCLCGVMAFMWARAMGGPATGPARAAASPTAFRGAESIGGDGGARAAATAARATSAQASFDEWSRKPIAPVSRNLFVVNYDFFPQDGSKPAPLRLAQGDGFWDQIGKSMTVRADQKKEREVLVENLRLQAAQLKVQSTVMGASPKALVNGELVGIGDVVASFRVSRIEARRIVVEREGIKLEIRFN